MELGQELVVRDGKFFTIGDKGAEFFQYKKNDIIFNAGQTKQLFEQGKITNGVTRGRAIANGTAFVEGNAFSRGSGGFWGSDVGYTSTSSSSATSTKSSSKSSSSSSSKEAEEFKETIDWIEIAIDRIERAISRLNLKASSVYRSWSSRNSALRSQMSEVRDEIELQQLAYDRYIKQANSVGLAANIAEEVREGRIDISTITDENLKEKIDEYQKWYEKALDCKDAIDELNESLSDLYQTQFDNVAAEYDGILGVIEHEKNILDGYITQSETKGWIVSANYYKALINNAKETTAELEKQRQEQTAALNDAVNSGSITKYSEAW